MNLGRKGGNKGRKTYLSNILVANMFILFIVIPALVVCGNWLFDADEYSYFMSQFSYLTLAGGTLFIVLLLYAAYFEYTFLLLSSYSYTEQKNFSTYAMLRHSFKEATAVFSTKIFFFLFYFLLILPFSGTGYTSELLSKIKIPIFILDYIFKERRIFVTLLVLLYTILIYLGVRLLFALPLMILQQLPLKQAIQQSLSLSKKHFWRLVASFVTLFLTALAFNVLLYSVLLTVQWGIEQVWSGLALYSATLLSTIAWFVRLTTSVIVISGSMQIILLFLKREQQLKLKEKDLKLVQAVHQRKYRMLETLLLSGFIILLVIRIQTNYKLMRQPNRNEPLVIAHRGVDGDNALQNSISALKKTHQSAKPYYTEMDIQETKDHRFVVSHDSDLKKLTGKKLVAQKLTLKQVTRLTAREGNHTAKLVSFDKYLDIAHKIHQPLIVEIKVSKYDSKNMLDVFVNKYGEKLLHHHDAVHSLDYRTVYEFKRRMPQLKVGYILPFNVLGVPKSAANFYSVEYSTLNDDFIRDAQRQHKGVYTWTVNRSLSMYGDLSMGVNGIITDNGAKLNKIIEKYHSKRTYTYRLLALMLHSYR